MGTGISGVDLGGIPLSRAPQILRRNTRFAGTVIRPDYQLLPRFGDPILGLASLDWPVPTCKQIKNYFYDYVQSQSWPTKWSRPSLIGMQWEHGPKVRGDCWLFILRVASWPVLCALKVRLLPSKVDNCNEGGSLLPHRAHISRASCLKNPAGPNDMLVFSARVQNV